MGDPLDPSVASWLGGFAVALGVDGPTPEEIDQLLMLAGTAARGSARQAAPVACWLAARAGVDPAAATVIAESVTL